MKKYENFCKALANLQIGLKREEPYDVVDVVGIVGLFVICFEQTWKLMKEALERDGRHEVRTGSPRSIIKLAYQSDMINDQEIWLDILDARNLLSPTYSKETGLETIQRLKSEFIGAFVELKKEIDEHWINGDEQG